MEVRRGRGARADYPVRPPFGLTGFVDEDRSFPTVDAAVHAAERIVTQE